MRKMTQISTFRNLFQRYMDQKYKSTYGTSLVVQGLRLCVSEQGIWVQTLIWEDSTCPGITKPVHCNFEPRSRNWKPVRSRAWAPQKQKSPRWETHSPQLESRPQAPHLRKARAQKQRPSAAKNHPSVNKYFKIVLVNKPIH